MTKAEILKELALTEEEYHLIYAPQALVKLTVGHLKALDRINALRRFNKEVQELCTKFVEEGGES